MRKYLPEWMLVLTLIFLTLCFTGWYYIGKAAGIRWALDHPLCSEAQK